MPTFDVIVIGGGPSGIFSAITAAEKGLKVLLLEKNKKIGNKILVAGNGKCNITHTGIPKDFISKYGFNGKFLKEALHKYSPDMLKQFFALNGLPLVLVEESGKYFPKTFNSVDVVNLLREKLKKLNVKILEEIDFYSVDKENDNFLVKINKGNYKSRSIILSTGGKSYPKIGTTGDGYSMAKNFGHKIVPPKPALTPVHVENYNFTSLSGISFKNINIIVWRNNKKILESNGDVLLTHTNFSGPGILDNSRYIENNDFLELNYVGINYEKLNNNFISECKINGKKSIKNFLSVYSMPERFINTILSIANIEPYQKISEISKEKRCHILKLFTSNRMKVSKLGNFDIAMATKGGVNIDEINFKTMESKIVKNLYIVGELLDIDGDTGGYNIQAACSMGVLAGKSINFN